MVCCECFIHLPGHARGGLSYPALIDHPGVSASSIWPAFVKELGTAPRHLDE